MAHVSQLPCDGEGICMRCKKKPSVEESLTCNTCVTPWHVNCLSSPPETLTSTLQWECPDCSPVTVDPTPLPVVQSISTGDATTGNLTAAILAIEADESLTREEKAKKRQNLMTGGALMPDLNESKSKNNDGGNNDVLDLFDDSFKCAVCIQLPDRPVTTPCGHNFCLKCFQKWVGQGKKTCITCRVIIPPKMASQPRINAALVEAIRMARASNPTSAVGPLKVYHFVQNQNKPDKAYTTERAKKAGKANACSGKIFVTIAPDHFGPILAENDPERKQGVLVGESWEDRMECRQWGAHFPHVAGIAGQSDHGAQSVALSGGYQDDEDHGEWFLYTGSGGRDLSGNKRTNKDQSFDQKFEKSNEALRVSCKKGYPVRVVRSHKEKRSSYAPETGVRYDGVYRIEKCWRKLGIQGYKVCRYLFVRCDNEPAPWTSDERGDRPRPLPIIEELKKATDITERKESPAWDYHETEGCWKWKKPPPMSRKPSNNEDPEDRKRARRASKQAQNLTVREKLLKGFSCLMCRQVMTLPVTTPCAHNFCKPCLEGAFSGQAFIKERTCHGRRTLRAQKNVMKCPSCPTDISDFLQNPQVNRELMDLIESLQRKTDEIVEDSSAENNGIEENAGAMMEDTKTSTQSSEILEGKTDENVEESEEIVENSNDEENEKVEESEILEGKTDENVGESEEIVENSNDEENEKVEESEEIVENSNDEENDTVEKSGAMSEDTIGSTQISELAEGGNGDMGVAESLQCKINGNIEKAVQDSSKEDNEVEKKSEAAMEDNKDTPKVSKIPEEGYREMKNDSTPTRTRYKRACNELEKKSEAAMEDNKATPIVSKIPEEGCGEMKNDSTPTRTRYKRACNELEKKSEAAMEDNKATPIVSKIPEEGCGEMENDSTPTRTRYKRACKRESPDGGKDCLSPNGVKKIKLSGKEPDVVIESPQNGTVKPEIPENDKNDVKPRKIEITPELSPKRNTPERSPKRKKANICDRVSSPGSGVRTRSMKS